MAHSMGVAIVDTDWQNFLLPGSDIPPDVCFLVKDATDGASGSSESIGAHKLLLAGSSPVFRGQFFGPMKETGEVVEVNDTRPEAFGTMIRYIYRSPGATTFTLAAISCPQELIEVHELANRYQILGLKEMTDRALDTLVITRDNMIFTASIAEKYKNTEFEEISKKLQMRCLKFLYDTTSGAHDMVALIQKTKESFPDADLNILCELINLGNVELGLQGDFFSQIVLRFNDVEFLTFPGWGRLIFFESEEHQVTQGAFGIVASLPTLGKCWKVTFDIKPIEDLPWLIAHTRIIAGGSEYCGVILSSLKAILQRYNQDGISVNHQLKIGEWTRIEITHEEGDGGSSFVSLSAGGKELLKLDVGIQVEEKFSDVQLLLGCPGHGSPAFIRRILLLENF